MPDTLEGVFPIQKALLDTPRSDVLACAGPPASEEATETGGYLRYYRAASILERRPAISRGTIPLPHPRCQADVHFEDDVVSAVRYTLVPPARDGYDLCEAIFASCAP